MNDDMICVCFLESCMNLHCFKAWRGRGTKGTKYAFPPRLQEDRVRVPAAGGCCDVRPGNRRRRKPAQVSITTADSRRWQYALHFDMLRFTGEMMKKASHGLLLSFWIESPSLPSSRRESVTPCFEWLIWGWSAQQRCSCVMELISTLKVRRCWDDIIVILWFWISWSSQNLFLLFQTLCRTTTPYTSQCWGTSQTWCRCWLLMELKSTRGTGWEHVSYKAAFTIIFMQWCFIFCNRFMKAALLTWPARRRISCRVCVCFWTWVLMWMPKTRMVFYVNHLVK